jgi:hypothetical protein
MFLLARHLTGDSLAGLVAAAVFMMVPYRVEHFEHLELQWTCFIPLSFWAVHKAFDQSSFAYGLLAGVLVWLQLMACVYYGVFLGLVIFVLSVLLLIPTRNSNRSFTALLGLMAGGVVAVLLAIVSLRPYLDNVSRPGTRATDMESSVLFSAATCRRRPKTGCGDGPARCSREMNCTCFQASSPLSWRRPAWRLRRGELPSCTESSSCSEWSCRSG